MISHFFSFDKITTFNHIIFLALLLVYLVLLAPFFVASSMSLSSTLLWLNAAWFLVDAGLLFDRGKRGFGTFSLQLDISMNVPSRLKRLKLYYFWFSINLNIGNYSNDKKYESSHAHYLLNCFSIVVLFWFWKRHPCAYQKQEYYFFHV